MYDTIIIGAGMSGLAAGIRLAYYDQKVCILERHYTIGGLNSFYRLKGRDYDVGLHAVTNFQPKGAHKGPLARLLRQLRLKWEDFALAPQVGSAVAFPDVRMDFSNDPQQLENAVAESFPHEIDNFRQLVENLLEYDELNDEVFHLSTREILAETIRDPLLREMILCPLMWYGNPREGDMDYGLFCIMFRSIFLEGFARPHAGVRLILKTLIRRFRSLGGELKLRSGVQRIKVDGDHAASVVLDNGEELVGNKILSSAGIVETLRLCDDINEPEQIHSPGQISFTESISVLDCQPKELGHDRAVLFFNDSENFHWESPSDRLCDVRTGVVCSPNNFLYGADDEEIDGVIRVSTMASYKGWTDLEDEKYPLEKLKWFDKINSSATKFCPDFRHRVIDTDMFTPRTIHRFTWHDNGAVYGAPDKKLDGTTHLKNLFICGTDQGFVGIIGTIVSGISIANQHLLR